MKSAQEWQEWCGFEDFGPTPTRRAIELIQNDARADLENDLSLVRKNNIDLLSRLEKAEAMLKEADWIINAQRNQHSQAVDLKARVDKWNEERQQ